MRYGVILADPPWQYKDKALAGKRGSICKYPVLHDDELMSLPVGDIADDNCVLFLWATFPKLEEALKLITSWGFTYKTNAFTWVKLNKKRDTPFMGMGNWTRSNAEICLLGVKGKPKRVNAGVRSTVLSRLEEHSKKPDSIRDAIVTLMGDIRRIELFARHRTNGWDAVGRDIDNEDIRDALTRIIAS